MRSFTIGRILGIPIRLNLSLLLFLPVLVYLIQGAIGDGLYVPIVNAVSPIPVQQSVVAAGNLPLLIGVAAAVGLFVGVLIHELGHSVVAMRYGIPIASITLWIFGGLARMEDLPEDWSVEFWVALAGPVTSALVAGVCYLGLLALPFTPFGASQVVVFLLAWLAIINLTLAVFNLLPAFPMDGGRILRALLARRRPYVDATQTAARVGRWFGVGMVLLGIVSIAPLLALVGLFVYVAARAEARVTALRELLEGTTARDMLREEPLSVRAGDTVAGLVDRMFADRRSGYPVVDETGGVVGLVSLPALRSVPGGDRAGVTVRDVMLQDPPIVSPDAPAFQVVEELGRSGADRVVVVDDGRVLGTLTADDVVAYVDLLQGIGPVDRAGELVPRDGYV